MIPYINYLLILPVIFTYFVIFFTQLFLLKTFKALNGLLCADVPLRNYSLTHSLTICCVLLNSRDEALEAFAKFNGRWYGGRQLSCRFTCVTRWKMAICGDCLLSAHCFCLSKILSFFN